MTAPLQEATGCLTQRGLDALRRSAPVPPELAHHLVTCASCQKKAMRVDSPFGDQPRKAPPSLKRTLIYLGAILVAAFLALFSMMRYR